jgi:restriction endonuclease Mrr
MGIPDFQTIMLPFLQRSKPSEMQLPEMIEQLAEEFGLTSEERSARYPNGLTIFANRVYWAKVNLGMAGLIAPPSGRGFHIIEEASAFWRGHPNAWTSNTFRDFRNILHLAVRVRRYYKSNRLPLNPGSNKLPMSWLDNRVPH